MLVLILVISNTVSYLFFKVHVITQSWGGYSYGKEVQTLLTYQFTCLHADRLALVLLVVCAVHVGLG